MADGNPIVWLSRLAGRPVRLVPGSDLVLPLGAGGGARRGGRCRFWAALTSQPARCGRAACRQTGAGPADRRLLIAPPMGFDPEGAWRAGEMLAQAAGAGAGVVPGRAGRAEAGTAGGAGAAACARGGLCLGWRGGGFRRRTPAPRARLGARALRWNGCGGRCRPRAGWCRAMPPVRRSCRGRRGRRWRLRRLRLLILDQPALAPGQPAPPIADHALRLGQLAQHGEERRSPCPPVPAPAPGQPRHLQRARGSRSSQPTGWTSARHSRRQRHARPPEQRAPDLAHPMPFRPRAMQGRPFGKGMARAHGCAATTGQSASWRRHAGSSRRRSARSRHPRGPAAGTAPALRPRSGRRGSRPPPAAPPAASAHRRRRPWPGPPAYPIRGRTAGSRPRPRGTARADGHRSPPPADARAIAASAVAIQPGCTSQSPSTNCTKPSPDSRASPALRARAAVKGWVMSSATTSAPAARASRHRPIGRAAVDIDHPAHLPGQGRQTGSQPRAFVAADHNGIHGGIGIGNARAGSASVMAPTLGKARADFHCRTAPPAASKRPCKPRASPAGLPFCAVDLLSKATLGGGPYGSRTGSARSISGAGHWPVQGTSRLHAAARRIVEIRWRPTWTPPCSKGPLASWSDTISGALAPGAMADEGHILMSTEDAGNRRETANHRRPNRRMCRCSVRASPSAETASRWTSAPGARSFWRRCLWCRSTPHGSGNQSANCRPNPNAWPETVCFQMPHKARSPAYFDMLRTRVLQALSAKGWTRIAVTSPTHGCGKSFVAANLALSMARLPSCRTVLMDLELREPELAHLFGQKDAAPLIEFLMGEQPLEGHFRRIGRNLALALNGEAVPHAAELLQDPEFDNAMGALRDLLQPDVVILFDTAARAGARMMCWRWPTGGCRASGGRWHPDHARRHPRHRAAVRRPHPAARHGAEPRAGPRAGPLCLRAKGLNHGPDPERWKTC